MPRTRARDDFDDDRELDDAPSGSGGFPGGTILAAVGFGLTLIVGGVIGFAAGRPAKEADKAKPVEVAQHASPATTPPPPETPPAPEPKPEPKPPAPEPKKPEVKKPEPKKPEPKKPEPKKPEPKKPDAPPATPVSLTFQKDILPIFKAKCNICHGDAGNPKGDTDLRTLASTLMGGVKPGSLNDSPVWTSIDGGSMPPANKEKLTAAETKAIKDWILAGAK